MSITEENGGWILPMEGGTCIQVRVDYALWLLFQNNSGSHFEVYLPAPPLLIQETGSECVEVPEGDPMAFAPALHAFGMALASVWASGEARLELKFRDGLYIAAESDPAYEGWHVYGRDFRVETWPDKEITVSVDGGNPLKP